MKKNWSSSFFPLAVFFLLSFSSKARGETVTYDLTIDTGWVNYTGNRVRALTINGQIPGPTLMFKEGDHAVINVHNKMKEETSLHWHGLLVPNAQDGVSYLTTVPIRSGESHKFEFPIIQSGTYWYHSHTNLQEQSGLYGSIVIHPKNPDPIDRADAEHVVVFSDWTDENPDEVLRTLKRASEWYSIKKNSVQSWDKVITRGFVKERLIQAWRRMPPMDVSDVYYPRFLANGHPEFDLAQASPGKTIRLRLINGSASSYLYVQFSGGPLRIISADGQDVEPVKVDPLLMAVAETYDVLVTVPDSGRFELRATAQDGSGYSSVFLGKGELTSAPDVPKSDLLLMMKEMIGMSAMDMSKDGFDFSILRARQSTALPSNRPWRDVKLTLTGNMNRYIWSMDDKTLTEADMILIRRGENIRMVLENKTMMRHPMHLHGHFFRVLNGQGDRSPLKHTVDVAPMETVTIEFQADEEKDWFFHCHILYHMMAGMARVVQYEGSKVDPALIKARKDEREMRDDDWFLWGQTSILTGANVGNVLYSNTRNGLSLDWASDWKSGYEVTSDYQRYIGPFLRVFGGSDLRDTRKRAVAGVRYLLPLYIDGELRLTDRSKLRFQATSSIPLAKRLAFNWELNTDREATLSLDFIVTKQVSITALYDSDYHGGHFGATCRF